MACTCFNQHPEIQKAEKELRAAIMAYNILVMLRNKEQELHMCPECHREQDNNELCLGCSSAQQEREFRLCARQQAKLGLLDID